MQFPEVCTLDQHGKGIDVRVVIEMTGTVGKVHEIDAVL